MWWFKGLRGRLSTRERKTLCMYWKTICQSTRNITLKHLKGPSCASLKALWTTRKASSVRTKHALIACILASFFFEYLFPFYFYLVSLLVFLFFYRVFPVNPCIDINTSFLLFRALDPVPILLTASVLMLITSLLFTAIALRTISMTLMVRVCRYYYLLLFVLVFCLASSASRQHNPHWP